jgi:hypothetical protein
MSKHQELSNQQACGRLGGFRDWLQTFWMALQAFVNRCFVAVGLFFGCGSAARIESYMKDEMRSWGVDESLHAAFWKSYMQQVRRALYGITDPQPANVLVLLPKDLEEAVLVVIKQLWGARVKGKALLIVRDTLEDEHPELSAQDHWRPLHYVRETNRYELKPSLARLCIVRSDIDPFERFYQWDRFESMIQLRGQYNNGRRDFLFLPHV